MNVSTYHFINVYTYKCECFRLSFSLSEYTIHNISEMIPSIEYTAFCVNCEEETLGSRVPLKANYVTHILTKCHINILPINEAMPSLKQKFTIPISNITFSHKWNRIVTKLYVIHTKQLLKTFPEKVVTKYRKNKKCLKLKCNFQTDDPTIMFKHIRNHVKKNLNT